MQRFRHGRRFANTVVLAGIGRCGVPPVTSRADVAAGVADELDHVLACNLLHLGFMWGGAVAMYLLVARVLEGTTDGDDGGAKPLAALAPRKLDGIPVVPLLCGAVYGFNPFVFREFGVLQLLALRFPPLAFLVVDQI
jgi:hypothetical protein